MTYVLTLIGPQARDQDRGRGGRARLLHLLHHLQPDLPLPHGGRAARHQHRQQVTSVDMLDIYLSQHSHGLRVSYHGITG